MANFPDSSLSFTGGFVDETSTDSTLDEQTVAVAVPDSCLSDPLLVEKNSEDSTDASNLSSSFQEESLEAESRAKFQDMLEDDPGTKFQDSLEVESSTKFQKNSLVFAKLSGHSDPPWPARVAKVCWKNNIHYGYEVFFYGTYQVGIVLTDKVWAYNEESVYKFSKPRIPSLRKRGDFSRGLIEIRDCPDIAPSRDISESASQIAKKLIRSSATNDIKVQRKRANSVGAVVTSTPDRSNGGVEDQRVTKSSKRKMTGIKKIKDKNISKSSTWILSPLRKLESSSDDDEVRPNKRMKFATNDDSMSAESKNATRRSERVKKIPYWKRLENNNKTADQSLNTPKKNNTHEDDDKTGAQSLNSTKKNTSLEHDIKNMSLQSQNKSKSSYQLRNASKEVEVKVKKYTKKDKPNTVNPSTNTPNNRRKSTETTPRPQKKAAEIRNTPARRPAAADSAGREEALTKSNIKDFHNSNKDDVKGPRSTKSVESDCQIVKEEPLSDNPLEWTVAQTVSSIIRMDPTIEPEDLQPIREHKIDGSVLIQLNFSELVTYCKVKVGPAIKIRNIVKKLNACELNSETNNEHFQTTEI